MSKKTRQWKATADIAIASTHLLHEREWLALQLAARVAGQSRSDTPVSCGWERQILGLMLDSWARASLAARYLDTLGQCAREADYEDVRSLSEELGWAEAYLFPVLQGPLVERMGRAPAEISLRCDSWFCDRLLDCLGRQIAPAIEIASAA